MAPHGWTNAEQLAFLEPLIPDYLVAQKEKCLAEFFVLTELRWFAKFPEADTLFPANHVPTTEDNERLGQAISKRKEVSPTSSSMAVFTHTIFLNVISNFVAG
jgi:hypothetical protein